MNDCVTIGQAPDWMIEDRTRLAMKDKNQVTLVGNYRPITCLKLLWKFLTGIFAEKTYLYLLANTLLPYEQKRVP